MDKNVILVEREEICCNDYSVDGDSNYCLDVLLQSEKYSLSIK